jgi:hypothetical protein
MLSSATLRQLETTLGIWRVSLSNRSSARFSGGGEPS